MERKRAGTLKRAVERAAFVAGERAVTLENVKESAAALQVPARGSGTERRTQPRSLRDLERENILFVLVDTRGHVAAAATILGLSRSQVYRRMQELGIRPASRR